MECGLVGLPTAGKTALFNALTGLGVDPFGQKPNIGIAKIPDPRLDTIAIHVPTQKIIHATLKFVDIPGVPAGSGSEKLNAFLSHVRTVDAICHVVRCFDDGSGEIDPAGDIATMETELVLADFVVADGAREKAVRTARSGDAEAKARLAVLEKCCAALEEGTSLRSIDTWTDEERGILRNFGMISAKPVLYAANIGEDEIGADSSHAAAVHAHADSNGATAVTVCAKLEAELSELEDSDRDEMLESLGLSEPALGPLARAANQVLGLTTFYTAGEKEVRAWTIPINAPAPIAAGVIHSDIQRGFIRAECFGFDDLCQFKSEKAIREAGKLRSEGKSYAMQDGDIVNFLFNV